jgi:CHASE2 domain-containing sensor protein
MGMPGVEAHANVIETIRRGAWLNQRTDRPDFVIALLVILGAYAIIRFLDGWRAMPGLCALSSLVSVGSLYVFNHHFIIPPLVPMLNATGTRSPSMPAARSFNALSQAEEENGQSRIYPGIQLGV